MRGAITRNPKTTTSATPPTSTVASWTSPSVPSQDHSSWSGFEPVDLGPGELGQLADHDVDRRAEQEAGDHGPRQELRDPPHLEHREEQEQHAGGEGDHRHEGRHVLDLR